jgi:hypothetical protein
MEALGRKGDQDGLQVKFNVVMKKRLGMFPNLYPVRKLINYDDDIKIAYSFQRPG